MAVLGRRSSFLELWSGILRTATTCYFCYIHFSAGNAQKTCSPHKWQRKLGVTRQTWQSRFAIHNHWHLSSRSHERDRCSDRGLTDVPGHQLRLCDGRAPASFKDWPSLFGYARHVYENLFIGSPKRAKA